MTQVFKYNSEKNAFEVLYNFVMQNFFTTMLRIELN